MGGPEDVSVPERFRPALAAVVERVAAGDYEGLKRDGIDPYHDADLSLWIRSYWPAGATIVPLPEEAWASTSAIPVTVRPGEWAVVIPLWTREEAEVTCRWRRPSMSRPTACQLAAMLLSP